MTFFVSAIALIMLMGSAFAHQMPVNDDVNTSTYMRIQGPTLIIEMVSTGGNVGDSATGAGHDHTIYRNPTNEYGQ